MTQTRSRIPVRDICLTGMFAAVTAVLAQISIPLPFTPVPISFGNLAVLIAGLLLAPRYAFFSQLTFLLVGAVGIPVFAGFRGGLERIVGPTGGYLVAYPLMALLIAGLLLAFDHWLAPHLTRRRWLWRTLWMLGAMLLAMLVCYTLGTAWLSHNTGNGIGETLALAVYPYVPLDLVKIVFAALCILPLRDRLQSLR